MLSNRKGESIGRRVSNDIRVFEVGEAEVVHLSVFSCLVYVFPVYSHVCAV